MILCIANAIPILLEQVQKFEDSYFDDLEDFKSYQLLFFELTVEDLTDKSFRTRNRAVSIKNAKQGFLLKQPRKNNRSQILSLKKESILCDALYKIEVLKPYTSKTFGFDDVNNIFFREWKQGVDQLACLIHRDMEIDADALQMMRSLGSCLAKFHQELKWPVPSLTSLAPLFENIVSSQLFEFDPSQMAYYRMALSGQPLRYAEYLFQSDISVKVAIEKLSVDWKKNSDTLIHGDIKLDNILYSRSDSKIIPIDWELAMIGDKAWDVSGVLYSLLLIFFQHYRIVTTFDQTKRLFAPFWRCYSLVFNVDAELENINHRVISYCGIRIIEGILKTNRNPNDRYEASLFQLGEDMLVNNRSYSTYFI